MPTKLHLPPPYEPGVYAALSETELGYRLWICLNEEAVVTRMETACFLERPAAEAIGDLLLEEFGEEILDDRVKQMTGHMIKQVLERRGYAIDQQNVKITSGPPFSRATRYHRPGDVVLHVYRATDAPREMALVASKDGATRLPPRPPGSRWKYERSMKGELQARVGLGVRDWQQTLKDVAEKGHHLFRQERLLRAKP